MHKGVLYGRLNELKARKSSLCDPEYADCYLFYFDLRNSSAFAKKRPIQYSNEREESPKLNLIDSRISSNQTEGQNMIEPVLKCILFKLKCHMAIYNFFFKWEKNGLNKTIKKQEQKTGRKLI
jgi:hypothetical protein